jgi:serine/threonine protein kinase
MLRPHLRLQQFELQERIGVGGDGEVWRVRCSKGKEYALKARPVNQHLKSFHKEFERLRVMRLPHIIRVHEMGVDKNYVFYTMDLVRGIHFQQAIQEAASFEEQIQRCIHISLQLCMALSSMHDAGLVHLDLKPGNVMVTRDNKVTLLDFGQACSLGDIQLQRSRAGTFAYMSPEQRIGHPTDQKTDCYALGICIYEALTGSCPTDIHTKGMPTPLILKNPNIPLTLSYLVEQLLQLDPNERPSAFQAQEFLLKLEHKLPMPTVPWPEPPIYVSDAKPLLKQSQLIYGPLGSGSRRMIKEARRLWHLQGYRSVAGTCEQLEVLLPLQEILEAIFLPLTKEERRNLAGTDAKILRRIAPRLPIVSPGKLHQISDTPDDIAQAMIRLFIRCTPIAVVIWNIHKADRRTFEVIQKICAQPVNGLRIWINGRSHTAILPNRTPEKWNSTKERALWKSLCPKPLWSRLIEGEFFIESFPHTPLHSCIQVWKAIEKWQNPKSLPHPKLHIFGSLGVLTPPFPQEVGQLLCPNFQDIVQKQLLKLVEIPHGIWYNFNDHSISLMLAEHKEDPEKHRLAAQAWQRFTHSDLRHAMVALHKLCAQEDPARQIIQALDFSIANNNYPQAHRWITYIDSINTNKKSFTIEYARATLNLYHDVGRIESAQFTLLQSLIKKPTQKFQYQTLLLANEAINNGVNKPLLREAQQLIEELHNTQPQLGLELYRTVALALLQQGQWDQGNQICTIGVQYAESLLRDIKGAMLRILQEKTLLLQITQSAILAHSMQYKKAISVCKDGLELSQRVHMERCTFGFLINSSICYLEQGARNQSKNHINQCARQIRHGKPRADSRAYCALIQAQLATEAGEYDRGFDKLDEAIALGQSLQDLSLLRQAWTLMLDTSISSGRSKEGKRAIRAYRNLPEQVDRDHWPAALARWYWMTGDISNALVVLDSERQGYAQGRVWAEKGRLLLINGQLREAADTAAVLYKSAKEHSHQELILYSELIRNTAEISSDAKMNPLLDLCRKTEWTDLYLGGLHLDLIRRKLRKQSIEQALDRFQERAYSLKHFLFCELSKKELWF